MSDPTITNDVKPLLPRRAPGTYTTAQLQQLEAGVAKLADATDEQIEAHAANLPAADSHIEAAEYDRAARRIHVRLRGGEIAFPLAIPTKTETP